MSRALKRIIWIGGILLLLATGAFVLLDRARAQFEEQLTSEREIVQVIIGDLSASASASGQVVAGREALLSMESPGLVVEVPVQVGDAVQAGDMLVRTDDTDLLLSVANAEQALRVQEADLAELQRPASEAQIAAAEAQVTAAQAALLDLTSGPTDLDIAAAEASVRSAEASVASASGSLSQARNSVNPADVAAARANLASAQLQRDLAKRTNEANPNIDTHTAWQEAEYALDVAEAQLDALLAGPNPDSVGAAQASLTGAQANLEAAQAELAQAIAGPSASQIASAEAQLAQAQASLATLQEGPSQAELRAAEAQVTQARLNLESTQAAVERTRLTAPFDGLVTAVNVSPGEFASGPVIEIVSQGETTLVLNVDEIDVGALEVGQPAVITLETWPTVEIESEITRIAPVGSAADNLVTYQVKLSLDTDLPVRLGMTGNANLITARREGVLLVPNRAINVDRSQGRYYVNLISGETTREVDITIGLRDNQYTQVTSGLAEGDELLIGDLSPNNPFGPAGDGPGQGGPFQ